MTILRIHLDGIWSARDFSALYADLQDLADFYETGDLAGANDFPFIVEGSAIREPRAGTPLQVLRVQFSSPGFTDVVGLAAVARELRRFLEFVIRMFIERNDRELAREEKRLEIQKRKIELAQMLRSDDNDPLNLRLKALLQSNAVPSIYDASFDSRITRVEVRDD